MPKALSPADIHELLLRASVNYFSEHVLGLKYGALKGLLYPTPSYRAFVLPKRNGSYRVIHEPKRKLKAFHYTQLHLSSASL
jgi:RNA-directed DNA polymerase